MRTKHRAQRGQHRTRRNQILLWIGVVATILFCLFPLYWIINTSLKTGAELSQGSLFPHHPSLDNYSSIFKNSDFTTALRTSLIDAGAATLIALTVGSFCAYALARLRFPRKFLLLAAYCRSRRFRRSQSRRRCSSCGPTSASTTPTSG
ncbi:MAG: hypothetical protein ACXVUL_06335 [Solirubrobacteraceae bacterium]